MTRRPPPTAHVPTSRTYFARCAGRWLIATVALCALMVPAPAYAWWGWLEKMSGPDGLKGPQFEFRVACFGEKPGDVELAESLGKEATALTVVASRSQREESDEWEDAGNKWWEVATAWAAALGEDPPAQNSGKGRQRAVDWQARALRLESRERAKLMATSSAGVAWSFCKPEKERRLALDLSWGMFDNDGSAEFAGGAPIDLTTLTTAISWRVFASTRFDVVEVSAGGGVYWFSSEGFRSKRGVVLQPGRLTFRAPSSWSGASSADKPQILKRLAAIPIYGIGLTVFPAGFEATDFAGVGEKAVRIPRELLTTQYFFLNVEPLIRLVR
jgi:hypothetical protein